MKEALVKDKLRCKVLFYFLNFVLSLTSFVMTIVNIFTKEYVLMISTFLFSITCALNILLLYKTKIKPIYIYLLFGVESFILLLFFFISGIPNGFSALWICLIPSFAMLIFGTKNGSIYSLLALGMIVFLFWTPIGKSLLFFKYTDTFMLRFPFLYCSIYLISLVIEYVRKETQEQLDHTKEQYRYLYRHDALTGLYNRYGIREYMDKTFYAKSKEHVAIILMDIDDFKKINDQYGHDCGDEVLKMVAQVPIQTMCEHCHCCRWGGEEFLLIMQCEHDPVYVAENIRKQIEDSHILYQNQDIHVTVSMGVCITDSLKDLSINQIVEQADKAMYESKNHGKNRVTVHRVKRT